MNHTATRTPSRVRGLVQVVAVALILLAGVIALNWPITFATATPASSSTVTQIPPASVGHSRAVENQSSLQTGQTVADVAEKANPGVVTITNYQPQRDPFTGQPESSDVQPYGVGSGYIVDQAGHVVTNYHVVKDGTAFEVQFYDGSTVNANLVGADSFQDVAVLQLDLSTGAKVPSVLSFGDSSGVRAGEQVIAIGSPYGEYTNTVTEGSVGAVDRALDTGDGYALPNLIQHSAPIYEGNSGGPLLNLDGQVIGMNVAKATRVQSGLANDDQSGIGFAIASDAIKPLVDEIVASGKASRAYLGIESKILRSGQGVVTVQPATPAETAGLKEGDIITGIDGRTIDSQHPFLNMLFEHRPGDRVELSVDRNGQEITVALTLGERPAGIY
jgi:S1-C subfamily serine protease